MKLLVLALCAAFALATTGCGDNLGQKAEDCTRPGDEDENGQADCDDPVCADTCEVVCGDGKLGGTEKCDDGNRTDGDGCDNNCTATGCGNNVQTAGEACDDGNTTNGDGCDNNCVVTGCGNGEVTTGEVCDDGNAANGDGCDNNCTLTACGNNVMTTGEACDDGNTASGDGCDSNCTATACGNGIPTMGEACDDGDQVNGNGCDNNCTVTACGNGVPTMGEACDDGDQENGDGCDNNCTATACGNGIPTMGEVCDDGNGANGDGCDNNCTVTACGNGVPSMGEACDDGDQENGDGCDNNCTVTACGNGIPTMGEVCDDGNGANGDGCDNNCTITACGNGVPTTGETCDDGNGTNGDGCDNNCTVTACGNGVLTMGEVCDDGDQENGDGCDNNCTITACGNGIPTAGEACDDGDLDSGDGCDSNCTVTACGNGIQTAGEQCDDGNVVNGDGCDSDCSIPVCGDGHESPTEDCDDGDQENGDGCDNNCTATGCGNGIPTTGEECDDGNGIDDDGCTNACIVTICGDGIVEAPETCDDSNTTAFDGCDQRCKIEPLEKEPNEDGTLSTGASGINGNDFGSANPDLNGAYIAPITILAAITPAGDEDVFKFTNPTTGRIVVKFDTWNRTLGINVPCATTIDTGIQIRNAAGVSQASNDDRNGALDRCSSIAYPLSPGESIYVHVIEFGDNAIIPAYALQAQTIPLICGDGRMLPGETCDDGNTTGGDGCSATCTLETTAEVEPNNTLTQASAAAINITGDATITAAITPTADVDLFRVTVATPTVVRFETLTSTFDCVSTMDLRLFDAVGMPIVIDTTGLGIAGCAAIVIHLNAGTYFIGAEERGNNAMIASYLLSVDFQENRDAESEAANMTGVNDTIANADDNLLLGNNVYVFGDHQSVNDVDVYAFTVPPFARIRAETIEGDRAAETCESNGVDTTLTLFDQNGVQLATDDDDGRGLCSLIDGTGGAPLDGPARNPGITAQTYYATVRRSTAAVGQQQSFVYRLQITLR